MKNAKIGLVMLVALAALSSSASAITWTVRDGIGYTEYNGHWYGLTALGTWDEAQAQAVTAGGNLVTIDDAAENQWLLDTFLGASPAMDFIGDAEAPIQQLWIGYTDAAAEGTWVWADGTTPGYENWAAGEPTNGGGVEDWGALTQKGTWNDYHTTLWSNLGYDAIQGIIETSPCIPAPGAILIAGIGTACVGYLRRRRAV